MEGKKSIPPGEAVRLSLLFFCCLCPCVFDFFMVCVSVFLFNSFDVSLFCSSSSVALLATLVSLFVNTFPSKCRCFSPLNAHISETIAVFDPSYFICFL